MTPRQRRFVDEYLIDLDGRHAAIRAGYAPSGAKNRAYHLLQTPEIADAIAAAMAERSRRTGITPERVLEELARIAFVDWRRLAAWGPNGVAVADSSDLAPAETAAIAAVGVTGHSNGHVAIATHSKKRALDTLARILCLRIDLPKSAHRA
ncbi:MAG: terminase small subunit [Alphaproteobacteria bacterium]|nr:terminase small subunit [Alphaproteobacteria bacterium]